MKVTNITKTIMMVALTLLLSTSIFAQDKPAKKDECCSTVAKHECTSECKTIGCDAVKAKQANVEIKKHQCTDECHTIGCAAVDAKTAKANSIKHVCNDDCKTNGCSAAKMSKKEHKCTEACKDGCKA